MKGDFSRDTFDPTRHFSSVRLQQGRVVTDADWNEQADLTRRRAERQALDLIGPCGAPVHAAGFALRADSYAHAVFADAANLVLVVGEDSIVLRSVDGGQNWTIIDAGTTASLHAVRLAGNTGWAVGDRGSVLATVDGGATWSAQAIPGPVADLRDVSVFDANRAWAVGDGGITLRTTDAGANWLRGTTDAADGLRAVHFIDANVGVAVGMGGTVLRSSDGGATWTSISSGTTAHLHALCFVSAAVGFAAGDGGTILTTTDGGLTWTAQASGDLRRILSIAFRDPSTGYAVGEDGLALQTGDGGGSWSLENLGTDVTLRGASLPAGVSGWIVGDGSVAVRVDVGSPSSSVTSLPAASLSILAGRFWVHGTLCELEHRVPYHNQPDRGVTPRLAQGTHRDLHASQRHLSALEEPAIREVALGGPDTASRAKTLAQVEALSLSTTSPPDANCLTPSTAWDALTTPPAARLRARAEPQAAASGVCEIAAAAGYRRLENQLYRVEIQDTGPGATFKWSRENGSVAYRITSVSVDTVNNKSVLRLAARGLDDNLDLSKHDRVEIVDDDAALEERVGLLFEYLDEGDDPLEVTLEGLVPDSIARNLERHPILRRWDHRPSGGSSALPVQESTWIDLEEGVQVWFEPNGTYRPGDYWQIPARTITGDVEWPEDEHGDPVARLPAGIEDHYCRLAIVEVAADGSITVLSDCRPLFPPVTELVHLLHVSGDGQDGLPGAELPQPLVVRAARGGLPLAGRTVRFTVADGAGVLIGAAPTGELDVQTDALGMAAGRYQLAADLAAAARYQRVRAALLDAAGQEVDGQVVEFALSGSLSMQHVSGQGQSAAPGQAVPRPLQVRVNNGQHPQARARVRFSVTAGGGTLVGGNPAVTGPNGIAQIGWQLGSAGAQVVTAELLDAGNNPAIHLAFDASVQQQGGTGRGGGCSVTIGPIERGGQFERLDTEVLGRLLEEGRGHVCLCFLPGEHEIEDLTLDGNGEARITIHGCGPSAIVRIRRRLAFGNCLTVEISNLSVRADPEAGLMFRGCENVSIDSVTAAAERALQQPFLQIGGARRAALRNCTIQTKFPGMAVVFDDAEAVCHLVDNEIDGIVSFHGPPAGATQPLQARELAERFRGQPPIRLEPTRGRLFMQCNALQLVTLGRGMVTNINAAATGNARQIRGMHSAVTLDGNTLTAAHNMVIGQTVNASANTMHATPPNEAPLATLIAGDCAVNGTIARRDDRFTVDCVVQAGFADAGNVAFVRRF